MVTVGMVVKDCQSTVRDAIESIITQDFPHELMEVIFVDDGSKDNTLAVIENYVSKMDMQSKVFSTPWRGLGPARNLVVNHASGEYIIWVDGDMVLPKDHVTEQVRFMKQNLGVGIAKARYGNWSGENTVGLLENAAFMAVDYRYGGKATSRTVGTGGSICRVKAARQVGGFDETITGVGEDMDFEFRIREAGWLSYLGTPAFFYERRRKTWHELWSEMFWHGYGGNILRYKNSRMYALYKMTPVAGFVAGVWYSVLAYRAIRAKIVFLLPFQYAFKRLAWCFGFFISQLRFK
jgi:glycosyltransferase involved in cell wall biosynthesis